MAMATGVAEQHVGYPVVPLGAAPLKRKWWGKGARQNDQRYNKNIYKTMKEQSQGFDPLRLKNLQKHNRLKTRKFKPKRRVPRTVPRAPFNDSSYLMRVRRSGGLASLVSPAPSSVFPSPAIFSHNFGAYKDFLDHEDYGYGSMTGLIRLRPTEDGDRSSGSASVANNFDDVNMCAEHRLPVAPADPLQKLEQRLDHGVSRFEMTNLPPQVLDASQRVARQDSRIKYLEDENIVLKDRLFLMQQEINELRQRLQGGQRCNLIQESDDTQSCLDS